MKFKIVDERLNNPDLDPPFMKPSTEGANSIDLRACIEKEFTLFPGQQQIISTGIQVSLPNSTMGMLLPRSGAGIKGLVLGNLIGNIDPDYRGTIKACVWNRTEVQIKIKPMDRIAQFVVASTYTPKNWIKVDTLDTTERGEKGLGSTGVK